MRWHRNGFIVLLWMIGLHSSVLWGQSPLNFVGMQPCRIADTRDAVGTFGGPTLPAYTVRSFPILSSTCGIPATASAYSLNVTVVPTGFLGYLTVWPTGGPQPLASTVNSYLGVAVANAAIVSAGTGGAVNVYATNLTDVILDIDGYFIGQSTPGNGNTAVGTARYQYLVRGLPTLRSDSARSEAIRAADSTLQWEIRYSERTQLAQGTQR